MKNIPSIAFFAAAAFLISCTKNIDGTDDLKQVTASSKVDTIIFAVDTLQYNFGSFGANEELTVIKQPAHASLFELTALQSADQFLRYAPQTAFLGTDSVVIVSKRITEEAEPVMQIDSVLLVINTVKNATHKNIIGKWILTSMCGGASGACDSIDQDDAPIIEFAFNMDFIETHNGSISKYLNYSQPDSTEIVPGYWRVRIHVFGIYSQYQYDSYYQYYGGNLIRHSGDMNFIYSRFEE
jgi:hypothetical protein